MEGGASQASRRRTAPVKKDQIFEFFRRLAEDNPSPETELEFGNTFQLLVAVVLSAQATDVGVNKATRALFQKVKSPDQMVALGEEGLKEHIKTIGLFNAKAKNVIALSEILVRDFGGEVPADRDVLTTLPGEPHGMGLLMAEAILALEGCRCLPLGPQTSIGSLQRPVPVIGREQRELGEIPGGFVGVPVGFGS